MVSLDVQEHRIERLKALLEAKFEGKFVALGRALGYESGAFVSQMIKGTRRISEDTVEKAESLPGCSGWFSKREVRNTAEALETQSSAHTPDSRGMVHLKMLDESTVPRITWGSLMEKTAAALPKGFRIDLPDDALAPDLKAGDWVEVDTTQAPSPGDLVLAQDAAGLYYVREYRQRRLGEWSAVALNSAYEAMDAAACGLSVVGCVISEGRQGRRSKR